MNLCLFSMYRKLLLLLSAATSFAHNIHFAIFVVLYGTSIICIVRHDFHQLFGFKTGSVRVCGFR